MAMAVAVALPFSGDLQQRRLIQPVVREHKVARERGRAGERAWLAAPSKARFQGSQGLVRFSNPLLCAAPSKAARLLAGCSKAHHACCNLPRPMISCSFLKLLSGGISIIALSEDPSYWTKMSETSFPRDHLFAEGESQKGLALR